MITLKNINKKYGKNEVISCLNLDINEGEFLVVLGPSGCGKTTLIRMISGLEEVTQGDICFDDVKVNDLPPKKRNISMVFQNYALFPNMNVYDNISFGLKVRKYKKEEIINIVNDIADKLQIQHLLKRKPSQLSGGEQQRVAIARAMVKRPRLYLFDEPLSNLDVNLKSDLRKLIKDIHNDTKSTFIYVTHDQNEALALADRIVIMEKGNIMQVDSPIDLYNSPKSLFVARFLGEPKVNVLNITDTNILCCIRPEDIQIGLNDDVLNNIQMSCQVVTNEFTGNGYVVTLMSGANDIKIVTKEQILDDIININFSKTKAIFFNNNNGNLADVNKNNIKVIDNKLIMEGK